MAIKTTIRTGANGKTSKSVSWKVGNQKVTKTTSPGKKTKTTVTTKSGSVTRTRVY